MQTLQLEHNAITGSQYTLKSAQGLNVKAPYAAYKQKMQPNAHAKKTIMLRKNTRLLKNNKKIAKDFYLVLNVNIDYKIEMPMAFDGHSLTSTRKRFDKTKTAARKAARLEKQAYQTIDISDFSEIHDNVEEKIEIKKSPLNLYANALQHTVTQNKNEMIFACALTRTNTK